MGDQYQALANKIIAPKAGEITVIATNTTAANLWLGNIGTVTASASRSSDMGQQGAPPFCVNRYVRFTANGTAVGLSFGANANAVSNTFAPNAGNTGIANSNTNAPSNCEIIPAGSFVDYYIDEGTQYMGYVAVSGTGTLIIRPSSQPL